ncbi:MAG: hypothetical protein ACI9P9_000815 [Patescibacteria group bacterium]|jgi:hypothetical protein
MVHEVNEGVEFSLRNVFNMRVVAELASRIKDVYSDFDLEGFVSFLDASLEYVQKNVDMNLIKCSFRSNIARIFGILDKTITFDFSFVNFGEMSECFGYINYTSDEGNISRLHEEISIA